MILVNVGLVPLDNRPCTMIFPAEIGKIANINVHTPPKSLLGNFLEPGCPDSILKWLEENMGKWDAIILSSDMLAYGGLIASRNLDTSLEDAKKNINSLRKIKSYNKDIPIYAFSILMRISITAADDQYARYWEKIHRYSYLSDPNLELKQANRVDELAKLERDIPKAVLDVYREARVRNHEINKLMIELVNEDIIDYLIIGQEDAAVYGVHRAEQVILREMADSYGLNDKIKFVAGADELAMNLLTKFMLDKENEIPSIQVIYDSQNGAKKVAPFEDVSIEENVNAHIESVCAKKQQTKTESADIYLFVNTPKDKNKDYSKEECMEFIEDIRLHQSADKIVVIADLAYANGSDTEFFDRLKENISLSSLASYGAWNTAGNTLGTVLSHSIIYWLAHKRGILNYSAHINFLLERFVDDHIYQSIVREELSAAIRNDGLSPLNLETDENKKYYDELLYEIMTPKIDSFIKTYFKDIKFYEILTLKLPWARTFEVNIEIECKCGI